MSSILPNPTSMSGLRSTRRAPLAAGLAAILLVGAAALYGVQRLPDPPPPLHLAFDASAAMNMAGAQVPAQTESFYFFLLDTPTSVAADAAELQEKMLVAARDQEYLGIAGPDPKRNLDTILSALHGQPRDGLNGLTIIYLGPSDHRAQLAEPLAATGAGLRFVEFPPLSSI